MDKNEDTKLSIDFFIDCSMNVAINKINEATKEISLLKHWALKFKKMQNMYKNDVIREINKRADGDKFYDCFAPIDEVED